MTPKIATCCYCGTRAALTLRGEERHELSCSNCGAPLHEMKMFRSFGKNDAEREVRGLTPRRAEPRPDPRRRKKKKKTKSLSRRFMEEIFDAAEDMFDIFD